jgi:uncharacterized Zn finger protein
MRYGTPITLDNFRNELNEMVLERGWHYWNQGWVLMVKQMERDFYEGRVKEVNEHTVTFRWLDDIISEPFCTCEQKNVEFCRHMAAVLFQLEWERNNK